MLSLISAHLCPVLPVKQAMFPVRNATDAHAQDFMVNDECYYSSCWNSQSKLAHYTLPEMDYIFLSLCSSERVCSYPKQSSSPPNCATPPPTQRESRHGLWSVDGLITYFIAHSLYPSRHFLCSREKCFLLHFLGHNVRQTKIHN